MEKAFAYNERMNTPEELRRIWNYQQRQVAKECISKQECQKVTLTNREFLVKLAQFGYKLRYRNIRFEVDEDSGWSILTVGKKKFYNATFGDMLTAIKNVYGKTPNFDNLRV